MATLIEIERIVEARLRESMPDVDLLEVTLVGRGMLRLTVDYPGGVTHEICADVTTALDPTGLREDFGVEVWSPGPERPLRTVEHFAATTGNRVRLTIAETPEGKSRSLTGVLAGVRQEHVSILHREGSVEVPFAHIRRACRLTHEECQ
jgi:ribosome maturation factor RimP